MIPDVRGQITPIQPMDFNIMETFKLFILTTQISFLSLSQAVVLMLIHDMRLDPWFFCINDPHSVGFLNLISNNDICLR